MEAVQMMLPAGLRFLERRAVASSLFFCCVTLGCC